MRATRPRPDARAPPIAHTTIAFGVRRQPCVSPSQDLSPSVTEQASSSTNPAPATPPNAMKTIYAIGAPGRSDQLRKSASAAVKVRDPFITAP